MKETVLGLNKDMKFYFCPEYVNMQKGIDSLCGFIRSNLMRDPFSNEVFIFMGRNKKQIKILRWDEDKFILYTVKLYNKKDLTLIIILEKTIIIQNGNKFVAFYFPYKAIF